MKSGYDVVDLLVVYQAGLCNRRIVRAIVCFPFWRVRGKQVEARVVAIAVRFEIENVRTFHGSV